MNAVEIEQAISALAEQSFDAAEFPFSFLQAFGNKETTLKRLRKGDSNKSDITGLQGQRGVLQTNNIHIAVAAPGEVAATLAALKASPATAKAKAKFILATDGELRHFPAEIARLALVIAEYQCDVLYRGQKEALADFLPLDTENWITCGNALRLDWLSICPPSGTGVKYKADDLFETPLDQAQIDFENEGGETYICGNPPYLGKGKISDLQRAEMKAIFENRIPKFGYVDYVAGWLIKAADYLVAQRGVAAFVTTNSICQGRQAPLIWSELMRVGVSVCFAHTSFKWANSATNNAAVMCVVVGFTGEARTEAYLFSDREMRKVRSISAYLTEGGTTLVNTRGAPLSEQLGLMQLGNKANDGGYLTMSLESRNAIISQYPVANKFMRRIYGSKEFNNALARYCLWIQKSDLQFVQAIPPVYDRIEHVRELRLKSPDKGNRQLADRPYQFREMYSGTRQTIIIPIMTSVRREYLPCGIIDSHSVISGQAFGLYDGQDWELSILLSKMHFTWIAAICGRLKDDYRYSNDLGWNTFPVPNLTDKNKADLTRCAEDILLAREAHFPKTIADLYDPDDMPDDLRAAHERNDEALERIYIGRKFRNDTERLEKLFELYTRMTAGAEKPKVKVASKRKVSETTDSLISDT